MVSPASTPNNQTNENERRKKQTIERTKVNHLSRQLQMRLQYARLKVDHGWQKQNLNEVENLYFHHAHQRGTKPQPLPSLVATTQNDVSSSSYINSRLSPPQSSLSFKVGSSPLSRSHINPNFASSNQEGTTDSTSYVGPTFHPPTSKVPHPSSSTESHITTPPDIFIDVDGEDKRYPTPSSFFQAGPHLYQQLGQQYVITNDTSGDTDTSRTSDYLTLGRGFSSAPGHPASSINYYSDISPRQPSSKRDPYNFASSSNSSSSTLTYDSFWSSRSFRGSSGNILANIPVAEGSSSQFMDFEALGPTGLESNDSSANKTAIHGGRQKNGKLGYEVEREMIEG